jgi:serine/threonine protein phosphatase PrpC
MRATVAPPVRPTPHPAPPQGSAAAGSVAVAPPAPTAARRDVAGALVAALAELEGALLAAAADGSLRAQLAAAATSDEELDELLPLLSSAPSSSSSSSLSSARVDLSMSGCTACVLVAVGPHVTVANVGDSRAVLIRREEPEVRREGAEAAGVGGGGGGSGGDTAAAPATSAPPPLVLTAWPLSVDHKPTLPGETRRILLAGGRLQAIRYDDGADGPVRVWLRDADAPGLAMSRSLGDTLGRSVGVCGVPDVYVYTLTRCDAYVCVATDGLWEFTPPAVVAGVLAAAAAAAGGGVRATGDAPHHGAGGVTGAVGEEEAEEERHLAVALDALAETAGSRWRRREGAQDDLAILVAQVGCA